MSKPAMAIVSFEVPLEDPFDVENLESMDPALAYGYVGELAERLDGSCSCSIHVHHPKET